MADYSALKATIDNNINTNGQQAITGAILNDVLNEMVDVLGEGYTFLGVATTSTSPATPEGKAYYLAGAAGTYTNFGNIVVASDEVALLVYDGTGWSKVVTSAASASKLNQVAQEITNMSGKFYGIFSSSENLPTGDEEGYAYVGAVSPFAVWFFDGTEWSDSGSTMDAISGAAENPFKGYYATLSALSAAYPSPISGNYAYVNVGNSVVHLYDVQNGIWHDTNIVISNSVESVFSNYAKMELLATLEKVAWIDGNGQTYLDTLRSILIGDVQVVGISAVFDSGDIKIVDTASVDYLKNFLTVTAELSDGTHGEITGYSLTGELSVGTCTITVEYGQLSTTFSVDVIANLAAPLNNWTYQPYTRGGICRYNGEAIEMKCGTATDVSSWSIWTIDNKKTMWSAVIGKTIKIRIKCSDQPYTPGIIRAGLGIYQSNSITSLGTSYARRADANWVLADDGYWEGSIVCDLANFSIGTLTPGANATFGLYAYSQSNTEYGYIYDVQMYEVTE